MSEPSQDSRAVKSGDVAVIGDTEVARAIARQTEARTIAVGHGARLDADAVLAGRPTTVVVDLGTDAPTLEAVAALLAAPGETRPLIVANLRDPTLRTTVDDNLLAAGIAPRPALVSTAALAAAAAIGEARPFDLAYWRGQDRMHAVLIGFSVLGRACFEELIAGGIAGDLDRPRVTVFDPDPAAIERLIARDMPEIGLSAELSVAGFDPLTLASPTGPIAAAASADPVTLIVVALDDPATALAVMASLDRAQQADGQVTASVVVVSERDAEMLRLAAPAGRARDLGRGWAVRGGVDRDPDVLGLLLGRADTVARRIHDIYQAKHPGSGPANAPWSGLSETYRLANRRAANHLAAKLWTAGLRELAPGADAHTVEPTTYANVIEPCAKSAGEDALLRRLSRLEHDRWSAERRLAGWRYAAARDNGRRLHNLLIPFDDPRLTEAEIEKDASQVQFLFGEVVRAAPGGAVTPLVLGILSTSTAAPGIDVEAALRHCRAETWRPIVVVSGLLDPVECRLLAELDAALTADGLDWRLVVPEITRDNHPLRVLTEPDDLARLAGFLNRPSTLFAPIGAPPAAVDLWADPSEPDPHAAAIGAYVAARAAAVIDGQAGGAAATETAAAEAG